jgi:hypothetical protein
MRTAVSNAASPRRLHWQAAFTTKNYQASSPVAPHEATHDHVFGVAVCAAFVDVDRNNHEDRPTPEDSTCPTRQRFKLNHRHAASLGFSLQRFRAA